MSRIEFTNDLAIKDGVWVDARAYGSAYSEATIQAAVTAIGADKKVLVIAPGAWAIDNNLTIPSNVTLKVLDGALMTIATAKVLTINGDLSANLNQVFAGAGSVSGLDSAYPEWWGVDGTADEVQIQAAMVAATTVLLTGDYTIAAAIVPVSDKSFVGIGRPTITITTANHVFEADGTIGAHLSNITIDGIKCIGQEATVTKFLAYISWVDNIKVINCETLNLKLAYVWEDTSAYAAISLATLQDGAMINNNKVAMTVDEDGNSCVFLRYVKNFSISDNIIIGHTTGLGTFVECFGGNVNPASDGANANLSGGTGRKCFNGVINNNVGRYHNSGINIAQSEGIVADGNVLDDCGESLWIGACKNVICSNNSILNVDNSVLQTQGICEDIIFDGNVIDYSAAAEGGRVLYIGSAWTSEYNVGPISFINNTVNCATADYSSFYDIGHLIIKNNTFHNMHIAVFGKVAQLEIENNSFIFDLFSADAQLKYYTLRLSQCNSTLTGLAGITDSYTSIKNNIWYDRTGVWITGTFISVLDPITDSNTYITGNVFKGTALQVNLKWTTSSGAIALTTFVENNMFGGAVDSKSQNTAATSHVYWKNNNAVDGQDYFGAVPTNAAVHYFSVGSIIWSKDPTGDSVSHWICIVEGAPGTWIPVGQAGFVTLANDATPTVAGGNMFLTGGTTTITDFDDGVTGQVITVIAEHGLDITDGTNIFLSGSANWSMTATDTLTLVCKADNKWYETARSDSGA
jgi:hypothetical protein